MKYCFILAFLLLTSAWGYAQRIAYVDQNLAVKDAATLKQAEAELKKIVQTWQDTFAILKKNYESTYAAFQKDSSTLSPEDRQRRTSELVNMQAQARQYERLKVNNVNGGDYLAHRNRLLEPVSKAFKAAVAAVAKSEKIEIVLSKEKIIMTPEAIDLTEKVAAKLK